jgi:hypothetical protein
MLMFVVFLVAKLTSVTIAVPAIITAIYARSWVGWIFGIVAAVALNEIALQAMLYTHVLDPGIVLISTVAACIWLAVALGVRRRGAA